MSNDKINISSVDTKLEEITKDIKLYDKKVESLKILDDSDAGKAAEMLSQIKSRQKRVEEVRQFFVKPLNDQVKKINEEFKKVSSPLLVLEQKVKDLILSYRRVIEQKRLEDEAKLQEKFAKKQEKLAEQGKVVDFSVAPTIAPQEKTIEAKSGDVKARKVWKFSIEEYSKIPEPYISDVLILAKENGLYDRVIRRAIASGVREIKGVRIVETEDLSVHL